ncbi:MAG: type III pantothenate kinase [Oscillospiraceae bacterium]|jgi:type III pantothenate kinase|nr:type III pantothenate kinase [Oscillospiraceae bacterium]
MLLAVDMGNTNITLGAYDGDTLVFTSRLATDMTRMSDQYAIEIKDILSLYNVSEDNFEGAVISSVVPPITEAIASAVEKVVGKKPLIIGPGVKTGLNIKIDNPAQLGADLVAVSVAALEKYPCPNVVCDLGTASTVFVLDKEGCMIGGVIYPGLSTSFEALAKKTAQLPMISFEAPDKVVGRNTIESMQSGLINGAAAMLDGLICRIERELGQKVTAIATGGFSRKIIPHCFVDFIYDENLVLEGLKIIFEKNR